MYFDRFDICIAYYLFACHYHGGQYSDSYKIFGRLKSIGFKASPLLEVDNLNENAREIYENLVDHHNANLN